MAKTALVTGASGFVGSHLVDWLIWQGWKVRCLVRITSNTRWIDADKVELVFGEVTQPETLVPAVEGADYVFHVAGMIRAGAGAAYDRVNVQGTQNLVKAVVEGAADLTRFILVSSLAAAGPSTPERSRVETDPDAPQNAYGRSKKGGEDALQKVAGQIPWTIIRPPAVYGPRDRGFMILARMASKGWTFRLTGDLQPTSVVHVSDLVRGAVEAALSSRTVGKIYYLAHPEATGLTAIGRIMAESLGKKAKMLTLPRWAIPVTGWIAGGVSVVMGRPNPLPGDRIRDLLAPAWTYDPGLAQKDFGFRAETDLEPGLDETVRWYREQEWL